MNARARIGQSAMVYQPINHKLVVCCLNIYSWETMWWPYYIPSHGVKGYMG